MRPRNLLVGMLVAATVLFLYLQDTWIQVSGYEVWLPGLPDSFDGFRILHISDLHGKWLGKDNTTLASVIHGQEPDVILCSGDMIDHSERGEGPAFLALLHALNREYPVYWAMGNHEQVVFFENEQKFLSLRQKAAEVGAILLDNSVVPIERGLDYIAVYGVNPAGSPAGSHHGDDGPVCWSEHDLTLPAVRGLLGVPGEGHIVILVAHDPKWYQAYAEWGADLVLAGHVHGGVVRLPFMGGVLSPDRTWFPKYDAGLYHSAQPAVMHVSRGLGDSFIPFRLFNRPDVSVIVLRCQSR